MRPTTEDDLSEMLRGATGPCRIIGGGTRLAGKPGTGEAISTAAMSGITLYEPGALTLVARAGTPMADIETALAAEGQRLAFEPADMRALLGGNGTPTVGGMVASNSSGPRRVQVGACRDSLIGVRFVDGQGAIIKNGGRVMKNVTGYDLVKLMAGSWGTLGVLTECSFKLLPVPEANATLLSDPVSVAKAVDMMSAALGTPYEVNGAARLEDGRVALRLEGFARQVAYRQGQLRAVLQGDWDIVEGDDSKQLWLDIRDVTAFAGRAGDVWRVSTKPSDAARLLEDLDHPVQLDWGGALIWVLMPEGSNLRTRLPGLQGHATLVRGAPGSHGAFPVFHPQPAAIEAISQGLRQKFDPRGILNPGLMG